jgi:putative tricarboxylic transport membrane protein
VRRRWETSISRLDSAAARRSVNRPPAARLFETAALRRTGSRLVNYFPVDYTSLAKENRFNQGGNMRKRLVSLVIFFALSMMASVIHAQPSLKMMIPANPGGGWDQTGRHLAAAMQSAKLVSSVQFDNKGGAGGTIGLAQFVNSAKGDPNAVLIGGMVMVGAIYLDNSPVNLTMVTPVARLTGEYEIIVVPANSPHKSMADLVKAFKANPGGVSWGGGSAGGTDHILVGLIAKQAGVDPAKINYVPFKGGGEAIAAIVGGHVTAGVSGVGEFAEQIKGKRMRALAVSSPSRMDGFQTLKEQKLDIELANWRGVFGAPGITTAQRDALIKIVRGATETKAWKDTVAKLGWSPIFLSGDEYKKFIDEDTKRIAGIIDSLGIKKK